MKTVLKSLRIKTGSFIKDFYHKVIHPFKLLHSKLLLSEEKPYLMFQSWLLDMIQYGVIATIVYSVFLGFPGKRSLLLVLGFGLGMWLVCETLGRIKKAIKD